MFNIQITSVSLSWNIALPIKCQYSTTAVNSPHPYCLGNRKRQVYWEFKSTGIRMTEEGLGNNRVRDKSITNYL